MKRISMSAALLFVLGIHVGAAQSRCGATLAPLVDGTGSERMQRLAEFHAKGKQAISALLQEIDNRETAPIRLESPFVSNLPFTSARSCGVVAAYLIELILGHPKLSLQPFGTLGRFIVEGNPGNYVYGLGYIVDSANGRPIASTALPTIKKLYDQWWNTNGERSLEQLRDDWKRGKKPLSGSDYTWR